MKIINLALFGPGKVGSKLIQQIIAAKDQLLRNSDLEIRIILIADSSYLITDNLGFNVHWKERFSKEKHSYQFRDILKYLENNVLVLEIDNRGILLDKQFFDLKKMKKIKIVSKETTVDYQKQSFIYDFLSSMRQKVNDPLGKRKRD